MKQLPHINNSEGIIGYSDSTIAKSECNDCFVRAVASSFECPYDTAHEWVRTKFNRVNRKGTKGVTGKMDMMFLNKEKFNDKNIDIVRDLKVLNKDTYKLKRTTLNQFIKKYSDGTYLLIVRGHAFTLKNGSVIGNNSDSKSLKKIVHFAYKIV